jgi:hypothetical protein
VRELRVLDQAKRIHGFGPPLRMCSFPLGPSPSRPKPYPFQGMIPKLGGKVET